MPCVGMLPPSFIDLVISRKHADGVLIAGCAEEDCFERLGDRWTEERIGSQRDPYLRDRVDRDRVAVSWASPVQQHRTRQTLAQFRQHLQDLAASPRPGRTGVAWRARMKQLPLPLRFAGQVARARGRRGTGGVVRHATDLRLPESRSSPAQAELQSCRPAVEGVSSLQPAGTREPAVLQSGRPRRASAGGGPFTWSSCSMDGRFIAPLTSRQGCGMTVLPRSTQASACLQERTSSRRASATVAVRRDSTTKVRPRSRSVPARTTSSISAVRKEAFSSAARQRMVWLRRRPRHDPARMA